MASLLADCPTHGPVMVDGFVGGTGSVTITGSSASCPLCGARASIPDGEYSFDDDMRPGWTSFRPITPARAIRVKTAARWAMTQLETGADEGSVKKKIDVVLTKEAPAWKPVVDALLSERAANLYQLLGFILMLLVFFGLDPASNRDETPPPTAPITEDQLREMLDHYLDEDETGSDTPLPPIPEPEAPPQESPPTMEA